jgi:hypothetical protein
MDTPLASFLARCEKDSICIQVPCTTCGAREFRNTLAELGHKEIIANLGALSERDFAYYQNTGAVQSVFKWLYFSRYVFAPVHLKEIEGSPAWTYFSNFCRSYQKGQAQRLENIRLEEERKSEDLRRKKEKATKDLPKAIFRKDILAIRALLLKGADPSVHVQNEVSSAIELIKSIDNLYFEFQDEAWVLREA